jgi:hypothetical protein
MEGLWRTDPSLRPLGEVEFPSQSRSVLRHLVAAGGLGIGSRVLVSGDEAATLAGFLDRLGIDAALADGGPPADPVDAAIWLHSPSGLVERSLLSPEALDRSALLLESVRPAGTYLVVSRIGGAAGGHEAECFERHVASFPGKTTLNVIPDRSFIGFLRGGPRPGYAVATWKSPAGPREPGAWRRLASAAEARPDSCCRWADEATLSRRAA